MIDVSALSNGTYRLKSCGKTSKKAIVTKFGFIIPAFGDYLIYSSFSSHKKILKKLLEVPTCRVAAQDEEVYGVCFHKNYIDTVALIVQARKRRILSEGHKERLKAALKAGREKNRRLPVPEMASDQGASECRKGCPDSSANLDASTSALPKIQ